MHLLGSGYSDTGRVRANNEDCFRADDRLSLYLVADGMGGHAAGEVASRIAAETIVDEVRQHRSEGRMEGRPEAHPRVPERVMVSAFRKANRSIREAAAADRSKKGMGTTLTAAWRVEEDLVVSHIGDSRAYLFRSSGLERLTRDHQLAAEVPGTDDPEGRNPLAHILTRALGPGPEIDVDTIRVALQDGDRVLLCSDGLYSELEDEGILSIVHAAGGPSQACRDLVGMANRLGGRDNVTAVVICAYSSLRRAGVRGLYHWISTRVRSADRGAPEGGGISCCESP